MVFIGKPLSPALSPLKNSRGERVEARLRFCGAVQSPRGEVTGLKFFRLLKKEGSETRYLVSYDMNGFLAKANSATIFPPMRCSWMIFSSVSGVQE